MEEYSCVAFIPVRGGSKSIPLKNIKDIAGKPLVYWVIEAAVNSEFIEKVFLSTDSNDIKECVGKINCDKLEVISRSPETATDTATSESALLEFAEKYRFKYVFFIQATSPLLTNIDIDSAWDKYNKGLYDSMLSVVKQKRFMWREENGVAFPINYELNNRPRRQEFQGMLVENGAFYLSSRELILKSKCRLSGNVGVYEMSEESYHEIDEPNDWLYIENILKKREDISLNKKRITPKLFIMDCDGVLTDGGMYYSNSGEEIKKFNTMDGMGIKLLHDNNIKTAIVTGENTKIVSNRAKKLGIDYVYQGVKDKLSIAKEICKKELITMNDVAFIGDDINDIKLLKNVGSAACPINAQEEVKNIPNIIKLKRNGGNGAVREFISLLLANGIRE